MSVDLRTVTERVRAAKVREHLASAEASAARQERKAAEQLLGPATRAAQATADNLAKEADQRLKALQVQLDQVSARAKTDTTRAEVAVRIRSRAFLHGGGQRSFTDDEVQTPASILQGILATDPIAGGFFECSRVGGQLMTWIYETGGDESSAARADELEVRAWGSLVNRIKQLAGEP